MKFLAAAAIFFWVLALSPLWAQNGLDADQNTAGLNPDQSQGVSAPGQSRGVPGPNQNQPSLTKDQRWVEQIDGSFSIPSFSGTVNPSLGLGGDINIGYRFDRTFCLFLGTGYYQYNVPLAPGAANALLAYIPLVAILRLTFGDGDIRPYVFGGAGIALNTYTQNNAPGSPVPKINEAETDFYLAPGLGIIYRFSSDMALFLQSRVDIDFTSPHGLGITLDSPSVFIPLQAGISFLAL
jgi:hypothetical protein